MPACSWILRPCTRGVPAVYCGKRVGWTMVRDDDHHLVRKYDHLCAEHQAESARLPPDEDD